MPINSTHVLYSAALPDWEDCRLFYSGEKVVKAHALRFIPKPEKATEIEYKNYVHRAFFFPAVERTVAGLAGAINRKDPTIEVPDRISHLLDNADSENSSLRQFSKVVLDETFITGRVGLMVDRDEVGSPPYLATYKAEDIINWHYDKKLGLTRVVLREIYYEEDPSDPFAQQERRMYRVLKLVDGQYVQEVWRHELKDDNFYQEDVIEPTRAGVRLSYIPFVFCNVRSITTKIDKPPLLDLVRKNAEHLRVSADYANSLYFTGNPILWVSGVPKTNRPVNQTGKRDHNEPDFQVTVGSTRAIFLPENGKIGFAESMGNGVGPNGKRADDIKLEMSVLGARLLEVQRSGVEAAETAQIRQSGEGATLSNIVTNVSAAIRKVLEMADEWEGGSGEDIEFELNRDFVAVTIDAQLLSSLANMVEKRLISWDTYYYNLATGEIAVPGRTPDEEKKLIEEDQDAADMGTAQQALQALQAMQNMQSANSQNQAPNSQTPERE